MEAILNFDLSIFNFIGEHLQSEWFDKIVPYITRLGDGAFWVITASLLCIPKRTRKIGFVMIIAQLLMLIVNNVVLKSVFSRTRPFALFNPGVASKCINGYEHKGKFIEGWMDGSYLTQVTEEMKKYSPEFIQKWLSAFRYPEHINYPYPHGYSFPSGHTSSSFAATVGMLAAADKKQKIAGVISVIIAAVIGYTRIYLCVHYFTDVLAGAVVGILCGTAGHFAVIKLLELVKKKTGKALSSPVN